MASKEPPQGAGGSEGPSALSSEACSSKGWSQLPGPVGTPTEPKSTLHPSSTSRRPCRVQQSSGGRGWEKDEFQSRKIIIFWGGQQASPASSSPEVSWGASRHPPGQTLASTQRKVQPEAHPPRGSTGPRTNHFHTEGSVDTSRASHLLEVSGSQSWMQQTLQDSVKANQKQPWPLSRSGDWTKRPGMCRRARQALCTC